jgi:hypothetical protein
MNKEIDMAAEVTKVYIYNTVDYDETSPFSFEQPRTRFVSREG